MSFIGKVGVGVSTGFDSLLEISCAGITGWESGVGDCSFISRYLFRYEYNTTNKIKITAIRIIATTGISAGYYFFFLTQGPDKLFFSWGSCWCLRRKTTVRSPHRPAMNTKRATTPSTRKKVKSKRTLPSLGSTLVS